MTFIKFFIGKFIRLSPLSLKMLGVVVVFSSVFTLLLTVFMLHSEYKQDIDEIVKKLKLVEQTYLVSLLDSMWEFDDKSVDSILEGVRNLPSIHQVMLRPLEGDTIVVGDAAAVTGMFERIELPLIYLDQNEPIELGELWITFSKAEARENLFKSIATTLMLQFAKTLTSSIFILWLLDFMVMRHLRALIEFASSIQLPQKMIAEKMTLVSYSSHHDELGAVALMVNNMAVRIHEAFLQQQKDLDSIRWLSMSLEQSSALVMLFDETAQVVYVNQRFTEVLGLSQTIMSQQNPLYQWGDTLVDDAGSKMVWQDILAHINTYGFWQSDVCSLNAQGKPVWLHVKVVPIEEDFDTQTYMLSALDISVNKNYEEQLVKQANFDVLTGLPNRLLALDRLELALRQADRLGARVGLMFMDLDNFKSINDTLGHEAGDQLLVEAAKRFSSCMRKSNTVARMGGDEFIFIINEMQPKDDVEVVAQRILKEFTHPFTLSGTQVHITTSVGIALYPTQANNSQELLQNADIALYASKHKGKSAYTLYTSDMKALTHQRMLIQRNLKKAVDFNELFMLYQPLVSAKTGEVVGLEALVRWNNAELGFVPPDQFIPIAEESDLIISIGEWILQETGMALQRIQKASGIPMTMAVNVSSKQLQDDHFLDFIDEQIKQGVILPEFTEFEVTERLLLNFSYDMVSMFQSVHNRKIRLSIDDFGTGYSALSYLKNYPFDSIKIDISFVRSIMESQNNANLVKAIINLANNLDMQVISEGVETLELADCLNTMGSHYLQGYYFSKPITEADLLVWLKNYQPQLSVVNQ